MDKQKIYNKYAKEQGYESWKELMSDEEAYVFETMIHVDNVTDLIQEELKKKIVNELIGNFFTNEDRENTENAILNTEIL